MGLNEDLAILGLHGLSRDEEEVMGEDEILGAEQEILGMIQAATANIKKSPAFQQALAARLAKRTPVLKSIHPTKKRRYVMGFGPTPVPPNSTVTAQAQPQVLFRGEKLINTGDTTGLFLQGIFVGNKPQLPTFQNAIAVGTFSGTVLDNEMLFDTCQPALFVTFQVQNTTGGTLTWAMTLVGHIVQS